MEFLLLIILPIFATTKQISQSFITRSKVKTFKDNIFMNALIFLVSAIIFSALYIRKLPNIGVFLYALGFAIFSILFQLFYSLAFKYGSVAITSTILGFAIVIQIIIGLLCFDEQLSLINYIGFIPLALSLVLMAKKNKSNKEESTNNYFKWVIFTLLAFIGNTGTVILQLFFTHASKEISSCTGEFVAWSYILSFILTIPVLLFFSIKDKTKLFKVDLRSALCFIVAGSALALYNYLTPVALTYFDAVIFLPIRSAIQIIVSFAADILFYKLKMKVPQWIGAVLAIVAVILIKL